MNQFKISIQDGKHPLFPRSKIGPCPLVLGTIKITLGKLLNCLSYSGTDTQWAKFVRLKALKSLKDT